jgi:phosphoribosylanthranilate isomerase
MKTTLIKICGVTQARDAVAAADLGAQAIGVNFYAGSKRVVSVAQAKTIAQALPPFVWLVGVFVNASAASIKKHIQHVGLHAVQLHGDEPVALLQSLQAAGIMTLRALHVGRSSPAQEVAKFANAQAIVLDTAQPNFGGSGLPFNWKLARSISKKYSVLLAGGLTPANVGEAVRTVRPLGVDVASGVERRPGVKDVKKMRAFIEAVNAENLK